MKISLCSDEPYAVHKTLLQELEKQGHQLELFGSFKTHESISWALETKKAAQAVASGQCEEGIFFCWTGTGASIAANKIDGIRAALCVDAQTAKGARIWNHANILVLSNRLISPDILKEILEAWFTTPFDSKNASEVNLLE